MKKYILPAIVIIVGIVLLLLKQPTEQTQPQPVLPPASTSVQEPASQTPPIPQNPPILGGATPTEPAYPWTPSSVSDFAIADLTVPLNDPAKALFIPWFQGFRTLPKWEDARGIGWQDMYGQYIQDGDVLTKNTGGVDLNGNIITATGPDLTVLRGILGLNDIYLYNAATHNNYPYYWAVPSMFHLYIDIGHYKKDLKPYEYVRDFFRGYKIKSSIQRI